MTDIFFSLVYFIFFQLYFKKNTKNYYPSETAAAQSSNWKKASNFLLSIQDDNNHPDSCKGKKSSVSVMGENAYTQWLQK